MKDRYRQSGPYLQRNELVHSSRILSAFWTSPLNTGPFGAPISNASYKREKLLLPICSVLPIDTEIAYSFCFTRERKYIKKKKKITKLIYKWTSNSMVRDTYLYPTYTIFPTPPPPCFSLQTTFNSKIKGDFFMYCIHLPPLRFHCVGGCWDLIKRRILVLFLIFRRIHNAFWYSYTIRNVSYPALFVCIYCIHPNVLL